jgi:hypothetical protein
MVRVSLLILCLLSSTARAADLVVSGRIDQVAAAGSLVAIVRGDDVRVLTEDGRALLHLDLGQAPPAGRSRRERVDDDVLELYGIPEEDRESGYAQDLIDDESSLRERRAAGRPADEPARAYHPLLAASAKAIFVAAGQTLWRIEADGHPVPTRLPTPFDHLAASPDGRLYGAAGGRLWRSDDGAAFTISGEAGPVRALAAAAGQVAWLSDERLVWLDQEGPHTLPLPGAHDLRFCGPALVALHRQGLLVVSPGATTSAHVVRARHLACDATGPWLLAGPRLQVSADEGQTFTERVDLPPATVLAVALGRQGLWVGTSSGLYRLAEEPGAPAPLVMAEPDALPSFTPARAAWAPLLPRLVLAASAVTWSGHQDLRTVAYADFPLGSHPGPGRRLLAQAEVPLVVSPPPSAPLPLDREAGCLPLARAEAVALALVEPERARSYVQRAGHAAWLPELRVRVDRRMGRSESLDLPAGGSVASGPLGLDTANDVRYEARATWDLSKLVFSTEEVAAASQALRMSDTRREIESLVNRLYFERRRLKLELGQPPALETRARRELRVQELEAELDALSGGAFTRCLPAPP